MYSRFLPTPRPDGVVEVVVEDGLHVLGEVGVVGDLDDHVVIDAAFGVVVPDDHGVDVGRLLQVDLHPLLAGGQLDEAAVGAFLVAVGDQVQLADDRGRVAGSDLLVQGQVRRCPPGP